LADGRVPRLAANWLTTELFGALNLAGVSLSKSPVDAGALGELIDLVADGTISGRSAKDVFSEMFETGQAAETIVDARGLRQLSDGAAIAALVDAVLAEHGDKVAEYRSGKVKLLGFFVGQVMKQTRGTANPQLVNEILRGRLAG